MKHTLLALLLLLPLAVFAQEEDDDVNYDVMGVRFGSSRNVVRNTLQNSYGALDFDDADEDYIAYLDKTYDGQKWDIVAFYFVNRNGSQKFNKCVMTVLCKTLDEARYARDRIARKWRQNFTLVTRYKGDDGEAYYLGGTSPTDSNAYGYRIDLDTSTITGYPYSATISYGGYDY
ncbi:MAG: hypothetical protein IJS89_05240 [Bacteroidaceae bacterium]|nr:hypothetical protein [Bacteroidaceae bacterium]